MITILTPSRSRPVLAKRMADSAKLTAVTDIEIKFFLNDDDPQLSDYKLFLKENEYIIGPNQSTSYSWNLMAQEAKHDIIFLIGDDAQFLTAGWDKIVLDAFDQYPDKVVCVYPRVPSLSRHKNPHFCLHKNWINTVGYFLPPHFYHWYVDTWVGSVAKRLRRFHCLENFQMPVETVKDDTNRSYHSSWMRQKDDYMWNVTQRHLDKDVETLEKFIRAFKK